jgi:outer membrane receptor protein involved in Fe transport
MENKRTAGYFSSTTSYYYYTPANAEISYSRLSPKLGAVFELNDRHHLYATYNQGFRTPSESQLFRGGRASTQAEALALSNAANTLKAIEAEQYEVGLRGNGKAYKYDVVVYQLTKKNDLLSQKDSTGYAVQTNNGETSHTGIELGFEKSINDQFAIQLATSYAEHKYVDWVTSTVNYSGKTIEQAPSKLSNIRLNWIPTTATKVQLEWVQVGSYKLDQANTYGDYSGHKLLNLRLSHMYSKEILLSARLMNLENKRWADSASQSSSSGALYAPGLPFTAYAGLEYTW